MKPASANRIADAAVAVFNATRERNQARKHRRQELKKYMDETGEWFDVDDNKDVEGNEQIAAAFDAMKLSTKKLIRARAELRREILKEVK